MQIFSFYSHAPLWNQILDVMIDYAYLCVKNSRKIPKLKNVKILNYKSDKTQTFRKFKESLKIID